MGPCHLAVSRERQTNHSKDFLETTKYVIKCLRDCVTYKYEKRTCNES